MREIKFRAWDKENKYMVQYDDICSNGGHYQFLDCLFEDLQDKYELMQFTGLTDKSGREIYEGDIVKFFNVWAASSDENLHETHTIVFEEGQFIPKGFCHGSVHAWVVWEKEVIGTIYDKEEPCPT